MGSINNDWDEEYSVIGDKVDVEFLDFQDDKSLHSFNFEEGPVVITQPFPFVDGKPQSALVGETSADSIDITNTTVEPVELWGIRIFSSNPEDSYILSVIKPPTSDADVEVSRRFVGSTTLEDTVLQPGKTFKIWLSCKPTEIGLHTGIVHFDLGDEKVERVAFLLVDDQVSQSLNSSKPYSRAPTRARRFNCDKFVAGSRPTRTTTHVFKNRLPDFRIPAAIRETVESKQVPGIIMEGLNAGNYYSYFSTLIAMEEIHLEQDMRAHDMEGVTMKRKSYQFLTLVVPGLAEKRPSLVRGDYIFAKYSSDDPDQDNNALQGYIHRVEADEVFLKFDKSVHIQHQGTDLFNVSFTYNRINMRRLYQAVRAAESLGPDLLFPQESLDERVIENSSFVPLNPNLNSEQTRSVEMILGCQGGPPYVIYGPPGTGKTMTLIEAIMQIYTTRKKARILVCASSNSAADHVLEKLLAIESADVKENEMFRLNAPSRPYDDIKPDYIRFCFFDDMVFACPPVKALLHYRIIISTYMSASLLHGEGIRRGHFSHIFLDEAGQASEPETMVPICNLCVKDTLIVLAGDPKQLGPVIHSRPAETYGLGKSYMERLFECQYYDNGNENYVTKLVKNYRCHPAILELPSNLFYKGELIACKEDNDSSLYDSFDIPNKAFPVYFIGIQGCDEREGNNPSWFNRIEASKVVEIIKKLRKCDIDENDIGVITPYRQQVLKIKKALESFEMEDVKVGSVEQFQGQERKVIIISTVRSTVKHNEFDRRHNLGFLSNPRRFNVAITRARALLIIVGNPHIITKDPHWDKLLRYCADNGSYQGCALPEPENHYYADEAYDYKGGQEFLGPQSNEEDGWGDGVPNQYNTNTEWDSSVPNPYSNDAEWGNDTQNQYSNKDELGGATNQTYTDEWGGATQTYTDEWGGDVSQSYTHAGNQDGQYDNGDGSWDYPKVQSTDQDGLPSDTGLDGMPPHTGWDDVPYEEPSKSGWDYTSYEEPSKSGQPLSNGWDDVPYEEPVRSKPQPPPRNARSTSNSGWDYTPYEQPSKSGKPLSNGWDDVPYEKPVRSKPQPPPRNARSTSNSGWDYTPYEKSSKSGKPPSN